MPEEKTITRFPHGYTENDDVWVPMPDGARLAAKLWLPDIAAKKRVPTILEVLPYRKHDVYSPRDAMQHRYFAGHGYASMRVDIRGTGDSDGHQGVFAMREEQDDTLALLEWIAAQSWSDGQVGMYGLSWGGFQAVQTAHRAPPQLKAIVPCSYAPDRYVYSQVYRGGCVLLRSIRWSSQMMGYKSRPPDPQTVGDRWRALWLERLAHDEPQIVAALRHQARDAYWQSRAIDYDRIRTPCFAASGWADGAYVGAVGETLARLKVPARALIGAWGHRFPHFGVPGPAVGFLQEALRWFDHWMRGRDTGQDNAPALIAWMAQSVPAQAWYPSAPGRWVAERRWPSPRIRVRRYHLNAGGRLDTRPGARARVTVSTPQTLGLDCGELMPWFQRGPGPELPGDQRADDGKAVCFDTPPLARKVEILGTPVAVLELKVDRPTAFVCVRLCDVAPDGASTRVSYGVFNLTHIAGADKPVRLVPERRYRVRVPLVDVGYSFARGHRIRVAMSTTYWPLVWPSPEAVTLTLHAGSSALELPVRPPHADDAKIRFGPAQTAPGVPRTALTPGGRRRTLRIDVATGETVMEISDGSGCERFDDIGLVVESRSIERYRIVEGEPLSCTAEVTGEWRFERGDWRVRTCMLTRVTCDRASYHVAARLEGYEGDTLAFERDFAERIARRGT